MKNIKQILIIGVLIGMTGGLFSCTDVLNVKPLDTFTADNIFTDVASTQAYIDARYAEMKDNINNDNGADRALRFSCDESYNNFNWWGVWISNTGQITPDQMAGLNTWGEDYNTIKNCNVFFENISLLKTDQATLNRMNGEVRFLRAFFYADLVNRYGGVPLITKVFTSNDNMMVPRNSYDDCMSFIINELDTAASLLPTTYDDANFGRATKGAALALKSRELLYAASPQWNVSNDAAKWQAAANAAKAVIDLKDDNGALVYDLDPSYSGLFLNNMSKEIIFMRLYSLAHPNDVDWQNTPNGYGGYAATCVTQDMVDSYEMADGSMPTPSLYSNTSDPWAGREPRFYTSIVCDGQMYRGRPAEFFVSSNKAAGINGMDSEAGSRENWNASKSHYTMRKFMDESLLGAWKDMGTHPWIYSRLGEIYLNYAEAAYHVGDEATARQYVNLIRARARGGAIGVLPDITASGADLLLKIQHERKIELAFEEHRYFDVRRWGIAMETENVPAHKISIVRDDNTLQKTYTISVLQERTFLSKQYLLPIPQSEILKNGLLIQNPGY